MYDNVMLVKGEKVKTEEEIVEELVSEHYKEVILPYLKRNCFFRFEWYNLDTLAWFSLYRLVEKKNGEKTFDQDPNCCDTVKAINSTQFFKYGCEVNLQMIEKDIEDKNLIEENFNMLTKDEIKLAESDERYNRALENTIVVYLKRRLNLIEHLQKSQINQEHKEYGIHIKTVGVDQGIQISWTFQDKFKLPRFRLLGYRNEEGFIPNQWSEIGQGKLVVDSTRDGFIPERLKEGTEYYYTFFVRDEDRGWRHKDYPNDKHSSIRFKIVVPTAEDIKKQLEDTIKIKELENRLEKIGVKKESEDPEIIKRNKVFKRISGELENDASLKQYKKTVLSKIQESEEFKLASSKEKKEWLGDTEKIFENAKFDLY